MRLTKQLSSPLLPDATTAVAHERNKRIADGPMTVFVPSNEALRKIPDEELEVIKNNSTALKGESRFRHIQERPARMGSLRRSWPN